MSKSSRPYHLDLQFRGHVEGLTYIDIDSNPLCHLFGGVPYALPPLGPWRFRKPRSLPSCYRYGTKANPARFTGGCGLCPQPGFGETSNIEDWDEDCLQSNVWVPAEKPPPGGWPVLFWIHGGFLQFGSPNDLDLRAFLDETHCKCVVVAPAYRVNIFGFLGSSTLFKSCPNYSANVGFWDQRMALQWTHENISYFGGDASNISVGGYSAGAHSVFHQLAYDLGVPDNKAVIKRALMLSNGPGMQPKSLEETELQLEELLDILGISKALTPAEQLENLCKTEASTLIQATHKMVLHQFRAVTDGVFVRQGLMDELDQGTFARRMKYRGVELIIGECSDEHYVYGTWRPPKPGFDNMLHRLEADYPRDACKVLAAQYFPNRKLPSKYRNWQAAFGHIYADVQIHALGRGMVSALIKHGAGDLIHRYRIEWRAKCVDKKYPVAWGATHSADMAMWFWGNGESLTKEEKTLATKAFHEPLGMFIRGEKMDWGTEHAMQIRTLRADGTIAIEEDARLEEGLVLWNALERVRSSRHSNQSKL